MDATTRSSGTNSPSSFEFETGRIVDDGDGVQPETDHPVQDTVDHPNEDSRSSAASTAVQQPSRQSEADPEIGDEHEDDLWYRRTWVRTFSGVPPGWPRLAAVVDSDPVFRVFRRFGALHSRLLLYHQDVVAELEERLDHLDSREDEDPNMRHVLWSRRRDDARDPSPRKELFLQLDRELKIYDELLKRTAEMYKLEMTSRDHRINVANIIFNDGKLKGPEREYIMHIDDLVNLDPEIEPSYIHEMVIYSIARLGQRARNLFRSRTQVLKLKEADHLDIVLYEAKRVGKVVNVVFTIIIVGLVMGPVLVLYRLRKENGYLLNASAVVFTAFFALLCSTATNAKRQEIFAVTAAYCAVLVVFTSQNSNNSNSR